MDNTITRAASVFLLAGISSLVHAAIPPSVPVLLPENNNVPRDRVGFFQGTDYLTIPFTISQPRHYQTTLTDPAFPAPFNSSQLAIITSTHLEGTLPAPDTLLFDANPGMYNASLFGNAGGAGELELFGVQVMLVSEPHVWLAMLVALSVLTGHTRRRGKSIADATPLPA